MTDAAPTKMLTAITIGVDTGPLSAVTAAMVAQTAASKRAIDHLLRTAADDATKQLAASLKDATEALMEAIAGNVVAARDEGDMSSAVMAACFNEWMRRYIEEPARFEREFQTVAAFQAAEADGIEPSYGETSAAYMQQLAAEAAAKQAAA